MKRKHKSYARPRKPFDKARIEEEGQLVKKFGLKNKREIWRTDAKVSTIRSQAKKLIGGDEKSQQAFLKRLQEMGLRVEDMADVLSLTKEDLLARRLQTIVQQRKLAPSAKAARQMIVHRKVVVDGSRVDVPSFLVPLSLENKITIAESATKEAPAA